MTDQTRQPITAAMRRFPFVGDRLPDVLRLCPGETMPDGKTLFLRGTRPR